MAVSARPSYRKWLIVFARGCTRVLFHHLHGEKPLAESIGCNVRYDIDNTHSSQYRWIRPHNLIPKDGSVSKGSGKSGGFHAAQQEALQGLSASRLAAIFHTSIEVVRRKLTGLSPTAQYNGHDLYDIAEAAQRLVKPTVDVEEYIQKMRPQDLPARLGKDFWAAQRSRQQFEEEAGDLWRTEKVQHVIGDLVKLFRQRVMLFTDTVERQHTLSVDQRRVVQALCDGLLEDTYAEVLRHFKDYDPAGDHDTILEDGPPREEVTLEFDDEDGGL